MAPPTARDIGIRCSALPTTIALAPMGSARALAPHHDRSGSHTLRVVEYVCVARGHGEQQPCASADTQRAHEGIVDTDAVVDMDMDMDEGIVHIDSVVHSDGCGRGTWS